MNRLRIDQQERVLAALIEGCSVRSIERMTGVHRDTILRLMIRVGRGCERIMDAELRGLSCRYLQLDEIWCYVGKKQRHVTPEDDPRRVGDFWTFVAIDADSKLVPAHLVGKRDAATARAFVRDLADRVVGRVHISSDMLEAYTGAVEDGFGADVDYGRIVKSFEAEPIGPGRYSPPKVIAIERDVVIGRPELRRISTSYVERQNLTMRMQMRRFTRLTNAFSKKVENLRAAVALHFCHYNFCRIHRSLRVTPAMAAGVSERVWDLREIIGRFPKTE